MPTYEYKCDACGLEFEKFQQITAAPVKKCPKCGKNKVRKLISAGAGMIFKGSGFYITDYRDQGYKDKAKADSASPSEARDGSKKESGTESKPESKTDSKPETKSESKSSDSESSSKSSEGNSDASKTETKAAKSSRSEKKK